jgi:transketolase
MFQSEFPDRYFQMGIAEQNMASTAAGFALSGMIPFIHSFAVFASGRAYDQLRNSICIPELPVRICGSSAGLSDFGDGKTHQGVEDAALMRALPNMTVLCPADSTEVEQMMDCMLDWPGPVYFRINRNDLPFVYPVGEPYHIGKVTKLRDGNNAAIFGSGIMVSRALEAAKALELEGISVRVLDISTIKPLDREAVIRYAAGVDAIVTAEEHSIIGGIGSAVVEALRGVSHAPVEFVGIHDSFGISAEGYEELLTHFKLTAGDVANTVKTLLAGVAQ